MLFIDRTSVREYLINEHISKKGGNLTETTCKSYLGTMEKILNEPLSKFNPRRAKAVNPAVNAYRDYLQKYPSAEGSDLLSKMETNMTK